MATEKTDVVIVGAGAAGGILAAELAKAGMKVIGLERGPRLKTSDFEPHDELLNFGNQAGGGTVHYGAVSWRFHEDDFRARSKVIERYGAAAVPADSSLVDW